MASRTVIVMIAFYCFCGKNFVKLVIGLEEDIFSSSVHLQNALWKGNAILQGFNVQTISENKTRTQINTLKFDIGFYCSVDYKWMDGIARHPIYIYSMVRDLFLVRHLLKTSLPNKINVTDLPTMEDYYGTVKALLRLQKTYNLKTSEIVSGIIAGQSSLKLTEGDCCVIGKRAHQDNNLELSISWLDMAMTLAKSSKKRLHKQILSAKADVQYHFGLNREALLSVGKLLKIDKNDKEAEKLKERIVKNPNNKRPIHHDPTDIKYHKLCRGEPTEESNSLAVTSKMFCHFYDNNRNPQLLLQPARQEIINLDPFMVVYRDVLSESEIAGLKSFAKEDLDLSRIMRFTQNKQKIALKVETRVSKGKFLTVSDPKTRPLVQKLQSRIQAITGLTSKSYEAVQVVNYGIGGYYALHYDWSSRHEEIEYNDRMATFLIYLNEVEAGGATVFPKIGVRMVPSKGDGILWYNLHQNGTGNTQMLHAACPVLLGTKWVANQWIGRHHQEFIRPCALNSFQ